MPEITECTNFSDNNIYPAYEINDTQFTPSGIAVDTSGQDINLETVDTVVDDVEACLFEQYPERIPQDVMEEAWCRNDWEGKIRPLDRSCITIKIPDTCTLSEDGTQYLLDRDAPEYLCEEKGLSGKGCSWRSGIQDGETIVTCPDLYMLPDPIVRYMTTCYVAWVDKLETCANPRTKALTGELKLP